MPHPESAWRTEIRAHVPKTCDYSELSLQLQPELSSWRGQIGSEPAMSECLDKWEGYIQAHGLAVVIEQASDDGVLRPEGEIASHLAGCPREITDSFDVFMRTAPEPVRDFLVFVFHCLVGIERARRTGNPRWHSEAPPGSPEVLGELMFRWGARFRRHRWTW